MEVYGLSAWHLIFTAMGHQVSEIMKQRTPALVRPRSEGGYEMISGHRRKRGCELCGKTTMPALVRNYTDDEAVIIMVDSNIQRENLLPRRTDFSEST